MLYQVAILASGFRERFSGVVAKRARHDVGYSRSVIASRKAAGWLARPWLQVRACADPARCAASGRTQVGAIVCQGRDRQTVSFNGLLYGANSYSKRNTMEKKKGDLG